MPFLIILLVSTRWLNQQNLVVSAIFALTTKHGAMTEKTQTAISRFYNFASLVNSQNGRVVSIVAPLYYRMVARYLALWVLEYNRKSL